MSTGPIGAATDDFGIVTRNAELRRLYGNRVSHGTAGQLIPMPPPVAPVARKKPQAAPVPAPVPVVVAPPSPTAIASVEQVIEAVAKAYECTVAELISHRRYYRISRARFAACRLLKRHRRMGSPEIGVALGSKDHTTALHGLKRAAVLLAADQDWRARYIAASRMLPVLGDTDEAPRP